MSTAVVPAEELAEMVARRVVDLIKSNDLVAASAALPDSIRFLIVGHELNRRHLGWGHAETAEYIRDCDPDGRRFPHGPACGQLAKSTSCWQQTAGIVLPDGFPLACGHRLRGPE